MNEYFAKKWQIPSIALFFFVNTKLSVSGVYESITPTFQRTKLAGHTQKLEKVDFESCALNILEYHWQSHCADTISISTIISEFWEYRGDSS